MSSRANRIAQNSMELCTEHQTRVIRELFGKINCLFLFPQKGGGGNAATETQRQIQDNQGIFFIWNDPVPSPAPYLQVAITKNSDASEICIEKNIF